jgi:NAD+ diphosphatase
LCSGCGFHLYDNPKFSVNIIPINEKGEILFALRKNDPGKGRWNTPGGFIDPGETAEGAARRELEEETGLKVRKMEYLGSYADRYRFNGIEHNLLSLAFVARVDSRGKLIPGDDAAVLKYFAPSKIPYRRLAIPSDGHALRDFLRSARKQFRERVR